MSAGVALVTGASKGIGLELARQLGEQGWTVLVGARDPERGDAAVRRLVDGGADAHLLRLDVTDAGDVESAARRVGNRFGRLDLLVNNAGINVEFPVRNPSEVTPDELRTTFETNVIGVAAVTNALLPLLRRASAGRIVNLSSELGLTELAADPQAPSITAYSLSKAAVNLLTVFYAKELRDTAVTVVSCSPGFVRTDINQGAGFISAAEGAQTVLRVALDGDRTTGAFVPAA